MATKVNPPGEEPAGQQSGTQGATGKATAVIVTEPDPEIRPRCRVVGAYCEALYWLQREPYGPAAVCCRHYWGDLEAAS